MTPEQRRQAKQLAAGFEALASDGHQQFAALLRAGIAASEECERLRRELAEAQEALRNLQLASDPLEVRTDNRETLRNALAEIERLLDLLEYADDDNDIAEEFIADLASEADTAWLAAWDAEWRAQRPAWRENAKLRGLLERVRDAMLPVAAMIPFGAESAPDDALLSRSLRVGVIRCVRALLAEIEGAL